MSFDPTAYGAACDRCYLRTRRDGKPVPPEISSRAVAALITEAPGKEETEEGRPLVGPAGRELTVSLASIGRDRDSLTYIHAMCCRPPGNDLEALMHRCQRAAKAAIEAGEQPLLDPVTACRPLVQSYLKPYSKVITVGKTAMRSVTGMMSSIMDMRGAPVTGVLMPGAGVATWSPREVLQPDADDYGIRQGGRFVQLLPTLHPSFVLRARRWSAVFRSDLARAFRWFDGQLGWRDPAVNYHPTVEQARAFLYSGDPFYAYDVETNAKESLVARLRCIGFATPDEAIVIPLLSVDGQSRFYSPDEEAAMLDMLRGWFTDTRIVKAGWNSGSYDRVVIEQQLGVTPTPILDGMLIHRNVDSELPHNLGFVGSMFTDVARAWKASHAATNAQSDEELHTYNMIDCVVNARIMQPLADACNLKGQSQVVEIDHKAQAACVGYHRNGIFVDQDVRRMLDAKYRKEAVEQRHILRMCVGDTDFNPNSVPAVRDLLFDKWHLPPLETTKLGDPSTNDDTIRKLLQNTGLQPVQKDFLRAMRKFRRAVKFRGTFIAPMRPYDEPLYEDDLSVDADTVEGAALLDEIVTAVVEDTQGDLSPKAIARALRKKAGLVLNDGRVHSSWSAHTVTTGRKSSSSPNLQNIFKALRAMLTAERGRMLVGSDYDQLELRLCAAFAGAERYLEAFKDPSGDPHSVTAASIYGEMWRNGSDKDKKRIRDFAKRFVYAVLYGASVETIHETIASAENDKGELIFPWVTLRETDTLFRRWMKENPEFGRWWETQIDRYRTRGFMEDAIFGRRRFFLDGEDRNEIINFEPQATGASATTWAEILLMEGPLPFYKWGPGTGLIHNGHDALTAEAPCKHCQGAPYKGKDAIFGGHPPLARGEKCPIVDAAYAIKEAMELNLPGYDVRLTATPKIGFHMASL